MPLAINLELFRCFDGADMRVEAVGSVDGQFARFGGRCMLLHNVLTREECNYLIQQMSNDMEPVQYRADYRRNERAVYESPELADLLWQRVRPVAQSLALRVERNTSNQYLLTEPSTLATATCPDRLQLGLGAEGVWHPHGLNECLRFCRYSPGGFFRPHCDAQFIRSEDERSLFTCMFYLDDGFTGGATRFLHIEGALSDENYLKLAEEDQVLASIKPEPGLCILFFQPGLLHEGEDVTEGRKHILRTDVMFRRDPATKLERSADEALALDLLREAEAAEAIGTAFECNRACALYRRAFKLWPKLERMC